MIRPTKSGDKMETSNAVTIQGFTVPNGFEFDGISIPWAFRSIVGGNYRPRTLKAVLLHDWLYTAGLTTRKHADELFYQMLRKSGVKCARLFYFAVRIFGKRKFKK